LTFESDLKSLPGSDPRNAAIAGLIHKARQHFWLGWIAKRPQMKSAANVGQQLIRGKTDSKLKVGY
jgi:hypothetical protein